MLYKVNESSYEFKNSSIGGAPQILKIYEHLSSQKLGVLWMNRMDSEPSIYLSGRRPTNYGPRDMWILDTEKHANRCIRMWAEKKQRRLLQMVRCQQMHLSGMQCRALSAL